MTRALPANSILPNKSQPFSIVWADNTDSICDLQCLLTYMDNYANKRHKADATRSSTTNGSARRASNGAAAPSSIPSSSSLPQPTLPPHNAPAAKPASATGAQGTSSTTSEGQDLSLSSVIYSTRSVFLSSETFAYLELCLRGKLSSSLPQVCILYSTLLTNTPAGP
jgi:hypothetical protein